jgi:hypothetical protein
MMKLKGCLGKFALASSLVAASAGGAVILLASAASAGSVTIYGDASYGDGGYSDGTYSGTNGWWGNFVGGCDGGSTWNDCVSSAKNAVGNQTYFFENVACGGGYYNLPNGFNISNMSGDTYTNGHGLNDSISSDEVGTYVSGC